MTFSNLVSRASPDCRHSMITIAVLTKKKERSRTCFISGAAFGKPKFDLWVRCCMGSISCADGVMPWLSERVKKNKMRLD
jgi:hypothetical protein